MYAVDATTRRAHGLQLTPDAWHGSVRLNPAAAAGLGVGAGDKVRVTQGGASVELEASLYDAVPEGCIWLPTAVAGTEKLGEGFGAVSVEKV
jgi:NADH-quinone oxidoreductase subunit G